MTPPRIKAAFDFEGVTVPLDRLLPTRTLSDQMKASAKHRALVASVREVGIVEPLSVFPQKGGKFLLPDGHCRVEALHELGVTEALCLIATENEGYTYNQKVD